MPVLTVPFKSRPDLLGTSANISSLSVLSTDQLKPETGPSVSEPKELFCTWASATSIPYTAGRLQLRRAHRITTPPKDNVQGHFSLKALTGILKGRKFPLLGAKWISQVLKQNSQVQVDEGWMNVKIASGHLLSQDIHPIHLISK